MKLLTIIPISRGVSPESLTYFSSENIEAGSIVTIQLRNKFGYGLVINSQDAKDLKSDIKTRSYAIKKVDSLKSVNFLSANFLKAVEKIADYFTTKVGATLSALISKKILENSTELSSIKIMPSENTKSNFHEILLLQSENDERYATYKSLVREEFARGKSVLFCLPTTEDLENSKKLLEKGIEKFIFVLHGGLSKKNLISNWQTALSLEHPVLILVTGTFLSVPRQDIGTIIVEKESSRAYKMQARPYLDFRTAALILTKENEQRLIFGDSMMRVETLWKEKNGIYQSLSPLKFRSLTTAKCQINNMREPAMAEKIENIDSKINDQKKEFNIFGSALLKMLEESRENDERTFLFAGRKGLFPITICDDCGTTVVCNKCSTPMVLYSDNFKKNNGKNIFVCHRCGNERDSSELCTFCRSWRLTPLGIGTDRVYKKLKEIFPDKIILLMDKEHVTSHKEAVKIRDVFFNSPGSILVGTEMALTYLNQKIENTAVVSIDSFFGIPDFRIHEKIFSILLSLRSLADKNYLLQTRQETDSSSQKIFDYALRGNLSDFYHNEIEERKKTNLPPFTTHIKISLEGEKITVQKNMKDLAQKFEPHKLLIFDALHPGADRKYVVHGLLSLPRDFWVDKILLEKLRSLPIEYMIKVDPDTLL